MLLLADLRVIRAFATRLATYAAGALFGGFTY